MKILRFEDCQLSEDLVQYARLKHYDEVIDILSLPEFRRVADSANVDLNRIPALVLDSGEVVYLTGLDTLQEAMEILDKYYNEKVAK